MLSDDQMTSSMIEEEEEAEGDDEAEHEHREGPTPGPFEGGPDDGGVYNPRIELPELTMILVDSSQVVPTFQHTTSRDLGAEAITGMKGLSLEREDSDDKKV